MIYGDLIVRPIINIPTPKEKQESSFVLTDQEITSLAKWALIIEEHYKKPMDIEWAKDGLTDELFIIQARPETVHSQKNPLHEKSNRLLSKGDKTGPGAKPLVQKITTGNARILETPKDS
jgi:pyruvate,water dikinase